MGNTIDHFYSAFLIAMVEASLEIKESLLFWEELVWKIDGLPLFDKRDSLGGQVSLHINDMIRA